MRLDPKLRYLAELAARKQRRTLSSFIEWVIEESLKRIYLDDRGADYPSLADQANELWDVDEPDRFAKLAFRYPHMLTHDEQVLWKLVRDSSFFWLLSPDIALPLDEKALMFARLREQWKTLNAVARGTADRKTLPGGLMSGSEGTDDGERFQQAQSSLDTETHPRVQNH